MIGWCCYIWPQVAAFFDRKIVGGALWWRALLTISIDKSGGKFDTAQATIGRNPQCGAQGLHFHPRGLSSHNRVSISYSRFPFLWGEGYPKICRMDIRIKCTAHIRMADRTLPNHLGRIWPGAGFSIIPKPLAWRCFAETPNFESTSFVFI